MWLRITAAICATLLLYIGGSVTIASGGGDLTLPIKVFDLASVGVRLIPSNAPGFDTRVTALFGRHANQVLELRPYLAILENRSARTIVAYTVSYDLLFRDGYRHHDETPYKYPDAIAGTDASPSPFGRGLEVRDTELRLVAPAVELDPSQDNESFLPQIVTWQKERFAGATDLTIVLDAVIFENGLVIGPNMSRLDEDFVVLLESKQALYRRIVERLEGGISLQDALRAVERPPSSVETTRQDRRMLYANVALGDVEKWRGRYGDDATSQALRKAIRDRPFVLRRESIDNDKR